MSSNRGQGSEVRHALTDRRQTHGWSLSFERDSSDRVFNETPPPHDCTALYTSSSSSFNERLFLHRSDSWWRATRSSVKAQQRFSETHRRRVTLITPPTVLLLYMYSGMVCALVSQVNLSDTRLSPATCTSCSARLWSIGSCILGKRSRGDTRLYHTRTDQYLTVLFCFRNPCIRWNYVCISFLKVIEQPHIWVIFHHHI